MTLLDGEKTWRTDTTSYNPDMNGNFPAQPKAKDEFNPETDGAILVKDKKFALQRMLVRCPKRNFKPGTSEDCWKCKYFKGFIPEDKTEELTELNACVICAWPMRRKGLFIPAD